MSSRLAVPLLIAGLVGVAEAQRAPSAIGTIVVAHGGDSLWNSQVLDAARQARTGGPVEVSFLMGPGAKATRFQDVVARLEKSVSAIVVVPMLVSSHSGHFDQIRHLVGDSVTLDERMQHHLHMAGIERPVTSVPIRLAPAMDDAPQVARVLTDRAMALADKPGERAVFIVGHGPNASDDYAAWMKNLRPIADSVRVRGGFRDVRVDLVRDDAPPPVRAEAVRRVRELIELQHLVTGKDVVVVPVLVSKGVINRDKLPNDLKGLPIVYSGEPLLPHGAMVEWIEERATAKIAAPVSQVVR
jgi:sirohydrochlorin cobaltochelatase